MTIQLPHRLLLSTLAAVVSALVLVPASGARTVTGPSGNSFYAPAASTYKTGAPGDLIWIRNAQAATTLTEASRSVTVVYKSIGMSGKLVPVSGTVWIPKGAAPRGGWPVVSWGHGTTGSADICAPSRITDLSSGSYTSYVFPSINHWLQHGYAVAMSDYEGLGTAGVHPWLIGAAEGRGVIDIVKAARKIDSRISTNWIAAGHSQGGHAVLFADSLAGSYGKGLNLKGTVAYAPANHMKSTVGLAAKTFSALDKTTHAAPVSGMGALLVRSLTYADPSIKLTDVMNPAPLAIMNQIETKCITAATLNDGITPNPLSLGASNSFGQFLPRELLKGWSGSQWADPKVAKALAVLDGPKIDPNQKMSAPVLILQGDKDVTVVNFLSETLATHQLNKTNPKLSITYKHYADADHSGVVAAGLSDSSQFMLSRFGR